MKIFVLSRAEIKSMLAHGAGFAGRHWFISIFSAEIGYMGESKSPLPNRGNVLKLMFDDVTERDSYTDYVHFDEVMAKKVVDFVKGIEDDGTRDFYVHCDAGISRSGAVGYMLNEWFNKYLTDNPGDRAFFEEENSHIMPNAEVVRLLKQEMFGNDYKGVFVDDYRFDEDGSIIHNAREV